MLPDFKIYNASAGAGKTFNLVREYLKICLRSDEEHRFMEILAITFTNKAAQEMKDRILLKLQEISLYPTADPDPKYTRALAEELGLSPEALAARALRNLKQILHSYSAFAVSTIDSFTNRLIRSFSRELSLSSNYQVETEGDLMLEEALDRLLAKLEDGDQISGMLMRFIEGELDQDRSGNVRQVLAEVSKALFQEQAQGYLEQIRHFEADDFDRLDQELRADSAQLTAGLKVRAQNIIEGAEQMGILPEALSGAYTPLYYAEKALQGEFVSMNKGIQKSIANPQEKPLYAKTKAKNPITANIRAHHQDFLALVIDYQQYFEEHLERYRYLEEIKRNLPGLAVLQSIDLELQELKEETSRLPIGEFQKIISRELQAQPAPFIYERLGERYRKFFIDEFQDTSRMQWQNLLPLVQNAMSQTGGSTLLVGDPKQSIYRFRGGEVQLFIDLSNGRDQSNIFQGKELYKRELINLGSNWRSRERLVDFNNRFFRELAVQLPNEDFQEVYAGLEQKAEQSAGGVVDIRFLAEDDDSPYPYGEASLGVIKSLLERGYRQSDICILTRSNAHARLQVEYLMQEQERLPLAGEPLRIISADSLQMSASKEVEAIVSFLAMLEFPQEASRRLPWLEWSANRLSTPEQYFAYCYEHSQSAIEDELSFLEEHLAQFHAETFEGQDLLRQVYTLCKSLDLSWQADPYLQHFLDMISDFMKEHKGDRRAFLAYWEEKGHKKSLHLPSSLDAIQVMSIHKSKGLEFPVVIVPHAEQTWNDNGKNHQLWIDLPAEEYHGLPVLRMRRSSLKEEERPLRPHYEAYYDLDQAKEVLDNINAYYVAFTRAEQELYIISTEKQSKQASLQNALQDFWAQEQMSSPEEPRLKAAKTQSVLELKHYAPVNWQERVAVISPMPKEWSEGEARNKGSRIHEVLAQLKSAQDWPSLCNQLEADAWFSGDELQELDAKLQALFAHGILGPLFSQEAEVYNERPLLLPDGSRKIPDRLVSMQGKWHLLDYKTGNPESKHHQQLQEYCSLLREAGIAVSTAHLVYLGGEDLRVDPVY